MPQNFIYYPNGGPYPGTCAMCGQPKDFWDINIEHRTGGSTLLCTGCISELANAIGFAPAAPMATKVEELETKISELEQQLKKIPTEIEGLIDGIRSRVTDFVLAVSDINHIDSNPPVSGAVKSEPRNEQDYKNPKRQPKTRPEPALNERPTGVPASPSSNHINAGHRE